jgi:hypothetical protein
VISSLSKAQLVMMLAARNAPGAVLVASGEILATSVITDDDDLNPDINTDSEDEEEEAQRELHVIGGSEILI